MSPVKKSNDNNEENIVKKSKYLLAEVEVRACDLGTNDNQYTVLTHLGKNYSGDSVLGHDVAHFNGGDIDDYKEKIQIFLMLYWLKK